MLATHIESFSNIYQNILSLKVKANWTRLSEHDRIPTSCKCSNPRITFDGLNWWISVGVECSEITEQPTNEGVGIDIDIKDLAVCYDQKTYKNIKNKKDENYCKTSSIIKSQNQSLKINRRLIDCMSALNVVTKSTEIFKQVSI